jgi:hypothetical protein
LYRFLHIIFLLLFCLPADAQEKKPAVNPTSSDLQIAGQYFQQEEYLKALDFLKVLLKNGRNIQAYQMASTSYLALKDYNEAVDLAKAWSKRIPGQKNRFDVDELSIYLIAKEDKKAKRKFEDVLKQLQKQPNQAYFYGKGLQDKGYPKMALTVYQEALSKNPRLNFDYQMAQLHGELGDIKKMFDKYINMVERTPGYLPTIKMFLAQSISAEDVENENTLYLKEQLIKKIQAGGPPQLNELLIHVFTQEKNFRGAFLQLKALDRRNAVTPGQLNSLAKIAFNAKEYNLAANIYEYVMNKGEADGYYQGAVLGYLSARNAEQSEINAPDNREWLKLAEEYEKYRRAFYGDPYQGDVILGLSDIYAYHLDKQDTAEQILLGMFTKTYLGPEDIARGQIAYADLLLYQGHRWDAIIFYRKAEKLLERSPIGQEAKFKRAKAAYYVGDFQWSQGIFKILKESTSKLIANDAMQYSLLITDNMALDSNTEALETYAKADLFYYRGKLDSALFFLNLLDVAFPDHPILDEALLMKGDIYFKQKNLEEAEKSWEAIVVEHKEDILADDALYRLANLHWKHLNDTEMAMVYFEKIFINYSDSFFAAEARLSYRSLRGDQLN